MTTPTGSGSTPVANLSMTGEIPPSMSNGTPQFNPPTITTGGSSAITIAPSINTPVQTYKLQFDGIDQCAGTPATGPRSVWVAVTSGGGPGTVTLRSTSTSTACSRSAFPPAPRPTSPSTAPVSPPVPPSSSAPVRRR